MALHLLHCFSKLGWFQSHLVRLGVVRSPETVPWTCRCTLSTSAPWLLLLPKVPQVNSSSNSSCLDFCVVTGYIMLWLSMLANSGTKQQKHIAVHTAGFTSPKVYVHACRRSPTADSFVCCVVDPTGVDWPVSSDLHIHRVFHFCIPFGVMLRQAHGLCLSRCNSMMSQDCYTCQIFAGGVGHNAGKAADPSTVQVSVPFQRAVFSPLSVAPR